MAKIQPISSISNFGQADDRLCVEYLGEGAIMELKAHRPYSKTITCTASSDSSSLHYSQWYLATLCCDDVCITFFDDAQNCDVHDYKSVLSWCVSVLDCSPTAQLMLKEAAEKDWKVALEDLAGGDYCIDVEQKLLILDHNALMPSALGRSDYFRNVILVTLIKALRDIWQERCHGGFDALYAPEHILLMERVRAADLDVMAVLVAWELRFEYYAPLWRHVIGSDIGDMAMVFSGYLERDPSSGFNGQALAAVFKQWFCRVQRVDICDHDTLEYLDDVLTMRDVSDPFGRKKPVKMNVEILSCLPDKTAYLQGLGAEILGDPVYAAIDNEINQTHLFHILYDLEAVIVENVPFRDAVLARMIFPDEDLNG